MDHPHDSQGGGKPPRKELQGPRPTPLKVRKDSHKIKKPPVTPPIPSVQHQQPPPQPPRQPVIIYTVSPKVIHTNPSDFMTLVQRLTGSDTMSASSSSSSSTSFPYPSFTSNVVGSSSNSMAHHVSGAISPAARFASIEKTKMPLEGKKFAGRNEVMEQEILEISDHGGNGCSGTNNNGGGVQGIEKTMFFPGILSPGPGSLPPISPNIFSPFFHQDLSAVQHQHGNRNQIIDGSYVPSPFSTSFYSPNTMFSPASMDLLHHILDS